MTKQEIITLLIKDYEEAIEKCKGMRYEDIQDYLIDENLAAGVCFAAMYRHNENIAHHEWIKRSVDTSTIYHDYWHQPPMYLYNKRSIIQSLQTRLLILKTELEIPE